MSSQADLEMEIAVSRLLRAGVTLAGVVVLVGVVLHLLHAYGAQPDYRHFHGVPSPADKVTPILRGVMRGDPGSIVRLGILILIATPILRVAYCLYGFAEQNRDAAHGLSNHFTFARMQADLNL